MARSKKRLTRRGRRPSLKVAARKAGKLQSDVKGLLSDLEDLERRLVRLDTLLEASRKAEREKLRKKRSSRSQGIRGKGPNVRDLAYQYLARRKKPTGIQEISQHVLKGKKGQAGENFTQNLGAALARDPRFQRAGRGVYTVKR